MKMDTQRQDYGSKKGENGGASKMEGKPGSLSLKAGPSTSGPSGPTGSSRTYPPTGDRMSGKLDGAAFNPMNVKQAPTYAVGGVGRDSDGDKN